MKKNITNKDIINGSFVIPEGITKIRDFAFEDCTNLESIIIPESVTKIGYWSFAYCTSLKKIIIPESVAEIGAGAFDGCKSLKKVSLPKKVKLGIGVFHRCHTDLKIIYRD